MLSIGLCLTDLLCRSGSSSHFLLLSCLHMIIGLVVSSSRDMLAPSTAEERGRTGKGVGGGGQPSVEL